MCSAAINAGNHSKRELELDIAGRSLQVFCLMTRVTIREIHYPIDPWKAQATTILHSLIQALNSGLCQNQTGPSDRDRIGELCATPLLIFLSSPRLSGGILVALIRGRKSNIRR